MDTITAREMAMDMPGTAEKEHHGRPSYSVKKKIYMTLWLDEGRAVIKLTPEQQAEYIGEHPDAFAPIPIKLGKHGWTNVFMAYCNDRLFRSAMDQAWRNVAPKWIIPTRQIPPRG